MGLLDGFFSDDPRQQAQLALAMGLLSGGGGKGVGGFARDLGRAGIGAQSAYNQASLLKDKRAEEEQQRKFREMQMGEMQRGLDYNKAFGQAITPAQPEQNRFALNDPNEPGMYQPAKPQGIDWGQLQRVDPRRALQDQQAFNKTEAPIILKGDETAFDKSGKRLFGNEKPKEQWEMLTPDQARSMGLPPGQGFQKNSATNQVRAVGSSGPVVNVGGPVMEKEENKAKAQYNMKSFEEIATAKKGAVRENSLIDAMLRNPIETSKAAPLTITAKSWLTGLGITGDRFNGEVSNAQAFQAAAKEMVLNRQLMQKGPQTESDARRLEETVASLGNTPDGNKAILAFSKAQNNRAIKQANFFDAYWRKNKTLEGAEAAWEQGEGGTSIWETPELKGYQGAKVIDFNSLPKR